MNGTTLLIMGVLSIICCPILGPVTWVMSNNALNSGTNTTEDAKLINIARILGIIGTVLIIVGCILNIAGVGLAGLGAATSG